MILYKYLPPARLDTLKDKRIRFTQPGVFNDPFEFRPRIESAASEEEVRRYVEKNFDQLLEHELEKYGALTDLVPQVMLNDLLHAQKSRLPEVFRLLESPIVERVSSLLDGFLNENVGVLCLSEVRDSILMWGHYTDNHRGFVVGFDSNSSFFSNRRSEQDEFGFLRRVDYQRQRPNVVLSDSSSPACFQTKSEHWAYEKEWRLVRVLSDAEYQINDQQFPVCLLEFPNDAVLEIIVGLRSTRLFIEEIKSLVPGLRKAALLRAREDPSNYGLIIDKIG